MEVYCNRKGGIHTPALILAMLIMIMMLLNAYCCGASVLAKSNTSFQCSGGSLDECRLIEEDLELGLEFLMNPYESRILAVLQESYSSHPNSKNPNSPACGKPQDGTSLSRCIARQKLKSTGCVQTSPYKRCNLKPPP